MFDEIKQWYSDSRKALEVQFFGVLVFLLAALAVTSEFLLGFSDYDWLLIFALIFGVVVYVLLPPENSGTFAYSFEEKQLAISISFGLFISLLLILTGGLSSPFVVLVIFPILGGSLLLRPNHMGYFLGGFFVAYFLPLILWQPEIIDLLFFSHVIIILPAFHIAYIISKHHYHTELQLEKQSEQIQTVNVDLQEYAHELEEKNAYLEDVKTAMLNILDDLEDERDRAAQIADQRRIFEQAVEGAADGIIITDTDASIIYVNPAWEQITGYTREEVVGKNPRLLKSEKTDPAIHTDMWKTLHSGKEFYSEEIFNKRKNGTIYQQRLSIVPIQREGKNVFFIGVVQDITEKKAR